MPCPPSHTCEWVGRENGFVWFQGHIKGAVEEFAPLFPISVPIPLSNYPRALIYEHANIFPSINLRDPSAGVFSFQFGEWLTAPRLRKLALHTLSETRREFACWLRRFSISSLFKSRSATHRRRDVIFLAWHCELCLKTHRHTCAHTLFANPAACVSIEKSECVYSHKIHSNSQCGRAFIWWQHVTRTCTSAEQTRTGWMKQSVWQLKLIGRLVMSKYWILFRHQDI